MEWRINRNIMEFKGLPRSVKSHERLRINRNIMEFKGAGSRKLSIPTPIINRIILENVILEI